MSSAFPVTLREMLSYMSGTSRVPTAGVSLVASGGLSGSCSPSGLVYPPTRIRELKIRARDMGDRRLRYGVTVPLAAALGGGTIFVDVPTPRGAAEEEEDDHRRSELNGEPPDNDEATVKKGTDRVIQWLFEDAPGQLLRVIPVVCKDSSESKSALAQLASRIGKEVYQHFPRWRTRSVARP